MSFLKDYINDAISLPIKDYMYIGVNENNMVYEYETSNNVMNFRDCELGEVKLIDFISSFKDFMGMYSPTQTFVTVGHDKFSHSQIINSKVNGLDYCKVIVDGEKYLGGDVWSKPMNFLVDNLPPMADILYIDVTPFHEFNFANDGLTLSKLYELNEFFENERVIKIYKKYNAYYIFY